MFTWLRATLPEVPIVVVIALCDYVPIYVDHFRIRCLNPGIAVYRKLCLEVCLPGSELLVGDRITTEPKKIKRELSALILEI